MSTSQVVITKKINAKLEKIKVLKMNTSQFVGVVQQWRSAEPFENF